MSKSCDQGGWIGIPSACWRVSGLNPMHGRVPYTVIFRTETMGSDGVS